jgi:acyl transferase domain-containing protein
MPAESERDLLKDALIKIRALRAQLKVAEEARTEPIAIVGVACRFPGGASTPEAYWDLLRNGRDAVCEIPGGRWDVDAYYDPDTETSGKTYVRQGGFLSDVDGFDADFFGISPREAVTLDPQQRLMLEVSWEALENAGLAPDRLSGTSTGVYAGVMGNDYAFRQAHQIHSRVIDPYMLTVASAREACLIPFVMTRPVKEPRIATAMESATKPES